MKKAFIALIFVTLGMVQVGCKKFVEVNAPETSLASTSVYESNGSAAAVLTGIYTEMATDGVYAGGPSSIGYLCGNAADELTNYLSVGQALTIYTNSYTPNTTVFWPDLYKEIYVANAAIQGLSNSGSISATLKGQLLGEAKFIRAFLHFYATNLFGAVPLVTTTNYQTNNTISRTAPTQVYQQIIADLRDAQALLSDNFLDPTGATTSERTRPNKGTAGALLARVYLYQQKWDSAEAEASSVISNVALYGLDSLNAVFLKNDMEGIWELQSIDPGYNTEDGLTYILTSPPGTGNFSVAISPQLLSAFEAGDNRLAQWIGAYSGSGQTYYFPYKYKQGPYNTTNPVTEYEVVFRLAEQYLIRAEAEAQQGNLSGAATDLNQIRNRAGLGNTTAATQTDMLAAIYHERQVELFTEWGHRWFDMQRTDSINSVMSLVAPQKGGSWAPYKALFPIPLSEIQLNSNLSQNPGYN
jgi:starch-binding outer membrane protein, SusD/RagB family